MMNLDLIRSFAMLGEVQHYGEAARRLGISQPSLTKQIRRLEDLLGAPLFERSRKGTELTAFGRLFLEDVRPVLRHAGHVWENGVRAARGERGRLAIGFTFSAMNVMPAILFRFRALHPEVELHFEDISSRHQERRVREGSLDAGFIRLPAGPGLASRVIGHDRLVLLVPEALGAAIDSFDAPAVREQPFLALPAAFAPGLEDQIQALFKSRGFAPQRILRANESLTILSLVAAGFGLAFMHEAAVARFGGHYGGVCVRPVPGDVAAWKVGLVWREGEVSPALERFLDVARRVVESRPAG
ncbi:LysR family transcriptional regulator [Pseudoxanthobacter sp.]|uniref:LysR family transcriptional regulator n=1 Tax=Pseudoxanthobacter sp. TaxID=1925742 RepID=UPI002FE283FE